MKVVGTVEIVVIAALGLSLVVKIIAQRREGARSIVLGKARDDLLAWIEPVAVPLLLLWFGSIALHGTGWMPELFEPRLFRSSVSEAAGALLALGALGLQLTALHQMGRSWRIGIDPDSHERLVTSGVFGISRNPIYLALDLIAVAAFLMSGSVFFLVTGMVVVVSIHVQVLREERFLASAFGDEYEHYRSRVARYLGRRTTHGRQRAGPSPG